MIYYKNILFLIVTLLLAGGAFYQSGCASAESTTGKLAFQQQDYIKAEAELKKGLAIDNKDAEGWYMLGYSQVELGKLDEAKESFGKSLSISNAYSDAMKSYWVEKFNAGAREFQNGIAAEEKKDKAGAKTHYEDALKYFTASSVIMPDSLRSLSAIGESYLALGMQDKAVETFKGIAAKSNNPKDAERVAQVLFESGLNMMSMQNFESAERMFNAILNIPTLQKNNVYYETSAYNQALALAKIGEGMRSKDENSDYKAKFAESLNLLKPLTQNLTSKELEPKIWELLVSVYASLGMNDEAQDALKKKESFKK
ncbi:MAG: hypothetical protein HGGPFJEG_01732 [Ignavibacteria bacterium]|nr:hypothetical protein [Ignavibacteria bacterium]